MSKDFYQTKINELLRKAKDPRHLILSPGWTLSLVIVMILLLVSVISLDNYFYTNCFPTLREISTVSSDVFMFGGTLLSLWETLQATSRQHALSFAREADALINAWEEKSKAHERQLLDPQAPLMADIDKDISSFRIEVSDINKTVEKDVNFARNAVIIGVALMFIGLVLTVFPRPMSKLQSVPACEECNYIERCAQTRQIIMEQTCGRKI